MNKKKKILKSILIIIVLLALLLLIYSGYQIFLWHHNNQMIENQLSEIKEVTPITEEEDSEKTQLVNPTPPKEDPYWDYIKLKLINVDFSKLAKINSDVVGWVQVNGTNINYPFVQTNNNKYYLSHQFDKKYNLAGWVFMDYRNQKNDYDKNTILYAHGRLDQTMFGSLRKVVKKNWYQNKDNYIVRISNQKENTLWQVFSTYQIKTTNDYLQISFSNDSSYLKFLNKLKKRSIYDYGVNLTADDKIITLSTCHNDTDKIVLHAKLIKRQLR